MRLLGAMLAGGRSSRFGSDKARALLGGRPLADYVRDALAPQVDALVTVGPDGLSDRPEPGLGPLGGLAAALRHAADGGFDAVLSAPCDAPLLPADLAAQLGTAPAYVADLPVIGLWPSAAADLLDRLLADGGKRSVRRFAGAVGAVPVSLATPLANVNTADDLARLAAGYRPSRSR